MPLFRSRSSSEQQTPPKEQNGRHGRHNREPSPASSGSPARSGSMFSRFRTSSRDSDTMLAQDPTIGAARQKVTAAEKAEREADKALDLARKSVREARQHVKSLEAAALEEIRRARAKQQEAKSIRKGADRLGRHDHT